MSLPEEHEAGRMLRHACTNIIGFWQLLSNDDLPRQPSPVSRMSWLSYLTGNALKMADLVLVHHLAIAESLLDKPQRIEEFRATARRIKFLAVALDGHDGDRFADEAGHFAWTFLGAIKRG